MSIVYVVGFFLALTAAPLEGLQMADNLRGCFNDVESNTLQAVNGTNTAFMAILENTHAALATLEKMKMKKKKTTLQLEWRHQLFSQIDRGRSMISECENSNPNNPYFAYCFANMADSLREDSLSALQGLQHALAALSTDMTSVVHRAVDCVTAQLQGARHSVAVAETIHL